jgi:hypothetical protein
LEIRKKRGMVRKYTHLPDNSRQQDNLCLTFPDCPILGDNFTPDTQNISILSNNIDKKP